MLLDIEQEEKSLIISYFNEKGTVDFKTYDVSGVKNWRILKEGEKGASQYMTNWDGRGVKSYIGKKLNKHVITNFLEELPEEDSNAIFGYNFPKVYFFDIETKATAEGYSDPKDADGEVVSISLVTPDHKIVVFGLEDLSDVDIAGIEKDTNEYFKDYKTKWHFSYKKFNSEYDMIYTFMSMVAKLPMLSGWNCIGYDWTYLVNRCKKLQIDPTISSPTRKLNFKTHLPTHVGIVDYMDLYANWDRSIGIKENYKLETAAKVVVGKGKIPYEGKLDELYVEDYRKYVFYNTVDSALVYYIDQKLKSMQIMLTLSNICKISIYKAGSPVAITESLLARNLLLENKVMGSDFNEDRSDKKKEQYTGAFVKAPIVGKHKGVACFDYASLYPSIMRQFNISPDSYIEKADDKIKVQRRKELMGKKIVTEFGGVYSMEDSILKRVLTDLYGQRKAYKKKSFEYKMKAAEIRARLKKL